MGIIKNFLTELIHNLEDEQMDSKSLTEEDILKAIDELPDEQKSKSCKIREPACWSEFKYLGKPEFKGLPDIKKSKEIYFTIPCGFEYDQTIKFWFITFPANCKEKEVKDFYTIIDPVEV